MPKCDFNKVTLKLYWNHTSAWVSEFLVSCLRNIGMGMNFLYTVQVDPNDDSIFENKIDSAGWYIFDI